MKSTQSTDQILNEQRLEDVVEMLCPVDSSEGSRQTIKNAIEHFWPIRDQYPELPGGLNAALALKKLGVDNDSIVSSILSCYALNEIITLEQIEDQFGGTVAKLVKSVRWMNALNESADEVISDDRQTENLRRMVLAVVEDVRAVLIKLVFRLERLKRLVKLKQSVVQQTIAQETLNLYAPLANRLGIAQIKWEMEDLAFRCLNPLAYKRIANALEEKRERREEYIATFVKTLREKLESENLEGLEILGRPKHIYSIWKKMLKKQARFERLFDVRAVRVMTDRVSDCYKVLGIVHSEWKHIPSEFDDYIANPKSNGYQSLHTAVVAASGKAIEIQIRTKSMNEHAEYGVAAHWRYKEDQRQDDLFQETINALRQMLDNTSGDDSAFADSLSTELFSNRVFARTPKGLIFDLQQGATVLDFAYYVHTDIGHRCRGAKVDGRIVPITTELKSGDEVQILTTREPRPSHDWLNKNLGYLRTSRARAKVRSWFNAQDHDLHIQDGKNIFEREWKRLDTRNVTLDMVCNKLKLVCANDLYTALGRNDISAVQLVSAVASLTNPDRVVDKSVVFKRRSRELGPDKGSAEITVRGVGNLLTQMATCCNPEVNDPIIGFITKGKGVLIHQRDCINILNTGPLEASRLIEVSWGSETLPKILAVLQVIAYDRYGLIRDVSAVVTAQNVDITSMQTQSDKTEQMVEMTLEVELQDFDQLIVVMDQIKQLPNVIDVIRGE